MATTPPLSPHVPIADEHGRPTPQFIQWWTEQRGVNNLIIPLTNTSEVSAVLDLLGDTPGAILTRGVAGWQMIVPGAAGEVLTAAGPGAVPAWAAPPSFLSLPDTPADYVGAAGQVATVNPNEDGLVFAPGGGGGGGGGTMLANGYSTVGDTNLFRKSQGNDLVIGRTRASFVEGVPGSETLLISGGSGSHTIQSLADTPLPPSMSLASSPARIVYDGSPFARFFAAIVAKDSTGSKAYGIIEVGRRSDPLPVLGGYADTAMWDITDLSSLWQDIAKTIPVTSVGQQIAVVDDLTGNGYDLTQSSDARMPRLGADTNGRTFIDFMTGSRYLTLATPHQPSSGCYAGAAVASPVRTSGGQVFHNAAISTNGSIQLGFATSGRVVMSARAGNYRYLYANVPYSSAMVLAGTQESGKFTLRADGAEVGSDVYGYDTTRIDYVGGPSGAAVLSDSARFYGGVLVGEIPAPGDVTIIESWLGSLF